MSDAVVVTPKVSAAPAEQGFAKDEVTPIAGLLGLDTHNVSDTDAQAIKAIYDFVRGEDSEITELELLHRVRQIEQKLGFTSLGERRLDKVHRYVKLQGQIDSLTKARDRELR